MTATDPMPLTRLFGRKTEPTAEWVPTQDEGQLNVDVFRDGDELVIRSTVSGVDPDELDIAIHDDLLTIRGSRTQKHEVNEDDWFYRECYWGAFSRSIILPFDVYSERTQASLKNGLLEIRLPIREAEHRVRIKPATDS
jgi:HSP20 family protein